MTTETMEHRLDGALPDTDEGAANRPNARQFITFATGNDAFAVGMSMVQEIIRVPEYVRVPLAPSTLNGLANLRGKVLPIISLRGLFGFESREHDDSTRVVVVDVGQPLGFVVDRVTSVVEVNQDQIEDVGTIASTVDTKLLSGLIKNADGTSMIMMLNFAKLIEREFAQIAVMTKGAALAGSVFADEKSAKQEINDELRLVSFHVNGQEYGVTIDDVQEIVQIPENITHVPHAESHVLGIMTLRSRLLPLVSLRRLFGLPEGKLDEKSRIVVLVYKGSSVGLAVDGVNEVLRVNKADVDPLPPLLAREQDLADIAEICRLENGKRLVSVITVRNLFGHSAVKQALKTVEEIKDEGEEESENGAEVRVMDDDEQVVVFRLEKEEFGVPIVNVEEIVRVPEKLTRVPKAPTFVEGVINLRGTVLPVLDLRMRLGMQQVERSERQRIMVFMISGLRTGFIVDQVAEVLRIPKLSIESAPRLSSEQGLLLSRIANLEKQKRIVQLLDPTHLVEDQELAQLKAVTKEEVSD